MERRVLINAYAKKMLERLQEDRPEIVWCFTIRDGREYLVGFKGSDLWHIVDTKPCVIGKDYEDVVESLNVLSRWIDISSTEAQGTITYDPHPINVVGSGKGYGDTDGDNVIITGKSTLKE